MLSKRSDGELIPRYMLYLVWAVALCYVITVALRRAAFSWREPAFFVLLASVLTYSSTIGRRDTWRTPRKWVFAGLVVAMPVLALIPFVHHS